MENNESKVINFTIDVENISEADLNNIKNQLKQVEKKVKEKNKPKTITISGDSHIKIKKHCSLFNLNIGEFTEKVLLEEIEKNKCIENDERDYKEIKEDESLKILEKYRNDELKKRTYIKSNILLIIKELKFSGYSYVDGKPIYEIISNNFNKFKNVYNDYLDENNVELRLVKKSEISKNIKSTNIEEFIII
jgi:hypothetical protein